jgi:membrane protein implicated in regulation of membrane protease activity
MVLVLSALLVLAGAVWLAQGLNLPLAPGSFMTGDPLWVAIGAAAALAGLALAVREVRERRGVDPDEPGGDGGGD